MRGLSPARRSRSRLTLRDTGTYDRTTLSATKPFKKRRPPAEHNLQPPFDLRAAQSAVPACAVGDNILRPAHVVSNADRRRLPYSEAASSGGLVDAYVTREPVLCLGQIASVGLGEPR